jgi:hypothetical protein
MKIDHFHKKQLLEKAMDGLTFYASYMHIKRENQSVADEFRG